MVIKRYSSAFMAWGLLILIIAGCKVGPNYTRPDIDTGKPEIPLRLPILPGHLYSETRFYNN